jgi:phage terminase large subunit GpA-like protein
MDSISDPLNETTTVMSSSQVGKTEWLLNAIGYFVDQDPSSILFITAQLELAQSFSKDRIDPMIRDTPRLCGKILDVKQKDKSNTILHKKFPGGLLVMAGANSPASLASRPIRVVLGDELDRYALSIGRKENAEGDPISIAMKRANTFEHRKKFVWVSTPGVSGYSRIEQLFMQSDQRHFMVPCTRCGHKQKLIFSDRSQFANLSAGRIVFDEANVSWAYYECEECKAQLGEVDKLKMVRAGEWTVTHPEVLRHHGYHIGELYSPWVSWESVAKDFMVKKQKKETLQVWVNTSAGETWREDEAVSIATDTLLARREEYTKVPSGVLLLTAGVDTQDDRFEVSIDGWGLNAESWLIAYRTVYGTPTDQTVQDALDAILFDTYENEDGIKLRVECTFIDSAGHYTQEVYKYVRRHEGKRVFAIVGRGGPGRPLIGKMTRNNRERARLIPVGVDDAKTAIMRNLALEKPTDPNAPYPQGYRHYPLWSDENYFNGLNSERLVLRKVGGFYKRTWEKKSPSARNEPLDTAVYSMAAMGLLNPNFEALAKRREEELDRLPVAVEVEAQHEQLTPRPVFRRRGNWVSRF